MILRYPQRHPSHTLENKSENYMRSKLPQEWLINRLTNDYGQDLQIEIVRNGNVTGQELLIQLKASHDNANAASFKTMRLKVSTYNYLKRKLGVVMLVKYVEIEDDAYWILLRDIAAPKSSVQSFTVRIPKENRISTIDWEAIAGTIERIANRKLSAVIRKKDQSCEFGGWNG